MIDDICSKLLVSRDEHLVEIVGTLVPDDEALAEFISLLWYRAPFGADPPQLRHAASKKMLALSNIPAPGSGLE